MIRNILCHISDFILAMIMYIHFTILLWYGQILSAISLKMGKRYNTWLINYIKCFSKDEKEL